MQRIKTLFATALVAFSALTVSAQDEPTYEAAPYNFIQIQGGGSTVFTNTKNFMDMVSPTFSVGVGRMFTPVVGARLHFNGMQSYTMLHSATKEETCKQKHKYLTSDIDVLLNITNIFSKNYYKPINLYFVGGVGMAYAWDNDDFVNHVALHKDDIREDISNSWGKGTSRKTLISHNIRAGLMLDVNVTKNLSVGLEGDINSLSDRFNSKYNDADDWMLTGQLSLTYKFGFKNRVVDNTDEIERIRQAEAEAAAARAEAARAQAAAAAAAAAKAAAAKKAAEEAAATAARIAAMPLNETIYFKIRESDPAGDPVLAKAVEWAKNHPNQQITITGYADKGTGTKRVNKKYSEMRAAAVADALKAQGVPADQLVVKSLGDTVQPYDKNDDNRCTILVGE